MNQICFCVAVDSFIDTVEESNMQVGKLHHFSCNMAGFAISQLRPA